VAESVIVDHALTTLIDMANKQSHGVVKDLVISGKEEVDF